MTPKEFATMLRLAMATREASWDDKANRYRLSNSEAATCVAGAEQWYTIIACLLTAGYADVWEWCDEVEKE